MGGTAAPRGAVGAGEPRQHPGASGVADTAVWAGGWLHSAGAATRVARSGSVSVPPGICTHVCSQPCHSRGMPRCGITACVACGWGHCGGCGARYAASRLTKHGGMTGVCGCQPVARGTWHTPGVALLPQRLVALSSRRYATGVAGAAQLHRVGTRSLTHSLHRTCPSTCAAAACTRSLSLPRRRADDAERQLLADIRSRLAAGSPSVATLRAKFREFDLDGSGFISNAELRRAMQDLGYHLSNDEMRVLMSRFQQAGDGISYDDFANRLIGLMFKDAADTQSRTRAAFGGGMGASASLGGTGRPGVDKAEAGILKFLGALMDRGGMPPRAALQRAFTELDASGDGRIDAPELRRWFASFDVEMSPQEVSVRWRRQRGLRCGAVALDAPYPSLACAPPQQPCHTHVPPFSHRHPHNPTTWLRRALVPVAGAHGSIPSHRRRHPLRGVSGPRAEAGREAGRQRGA